MTGLLDVLGFVIAALDRVDAQYSIGGSLASSFAGEPRASLDADIVVGLSAAQVSSFVNALGPDFYADEGSLHRAVASGASTNVIHHATGIKVDLFIASSALDRQQLARRRQVAIGGHMWFIHSPEDILLQKLLWYRKTGESSERQWRDVLGIALVQGTSLDTDYLASMAASLQLTDLLERTWRDAQRPKG